MITLGKSNYMKACGYNTFPDVFQKLWSLTQSKAKPKQNLIPQSPLS